MTPARRFTCGFLAAVASCVVAVLLAPDPAPGSRVAVVTLLVLLYAVCVRVLTTAVGTAVIAWALVIAFFLGTERLGHAPVVLAVFVLVAATGTLYGRLGIRS
ncbi:hypothetical protein [Nonomuraea aridisoli]|uniref:Uncharacterized protein n=1 Tax=Nonomuraea aridisoli TaxID=2070368 RepID=A0A2W2EPE1_9ACTN|nr:hypothetical protein [Nonomuraea aridisoli]PZG18455.1 hypothetical protein C1J01_15050 [Nonomuraea aridisoli]